MQFTQHLKPSWDESTGTANVIPTTFSSISQQTFEACFGRKQFTPNDANRLLGCSALPKIPTKFLEGEHSSRVKLLNCLNVTLALESIIIQSGEESPFAAASSAVLKMSLQPLWTAFLDFVKMKFDLRSKALMGCDVDNAHVRRLVSTHPFSPELFSTEMVGDLHQQAIHQAKSTIALLEFQAGAKRSLGVYRSRSARRRRPSIYVPRFQFGRFTPRSGGGRSYQSQYYQKGSPSRSYSVSPRRDRSRSPGGYQRRFFLAHPC